MSVDHGYPLAFLPAVPNSAPTTGPAAPVTELVLTNNNWFQENDIPRNLRLNLLFIDGRTVVLTADEPTEEAPIATGALPNESPGELPS